MREAIRDQHLTSMDAVFTALEWTTPNGCDKCRPAVNYYLISTWPHEAKDDPQSRFINERTHANIQKDGTYSVVPRMWGGLTTPAELRAIADAAEKYNVPTVKVTGGQRIDLLGIKKEDLPKMWADLNAAGMVSGHAYGKSIRTVKTCVGTEHCRFGTQVRWTWASSWRTCCSTCTRRTRSSWRCPVVRATAPKPASRTSASSASIPVTRLYVAGNGGIKTEVAQFLCKVKTDEEVMEYSGAFLQLYREEGWYLERTCHYLERVGMDYVKGKIVEDERRPQGALRRAARLAEGRQGSVGDFPRAGSDQAVRRRSRSKPPN